MSRARDRDLDIWRGQISQEVEQHGRRLGSLNGDLRRIWERLDAIREDQATMRGALERTRSDVAEAATAIRQAREKETVDREHEFEEFKRVVRESSLSRADIWRHLVLPILVALVSAVLIYVIVDRAGATSANNSTPPSLTTGR